jgi:hypothetical protein
MKQLVVVSKLADVPLSHIPVKIDRSTILGNPFTIKESGSRAAAIKMHKEWLFASVTNKPKQAQPMLRLLRNLVKAYMCGVEFAFVCHCAPKPCHGDTLISFIEWAAKQANLNAAKRAAVVK